jgi:hypothetical protein
VRSPIPIKGYTSGVAGRHKLVLQRFSTARHRWVARAAQRVRAGAYEFSAQYRSTPGTARYRTVLHLGPRRAHVSNVLKVEVIAMPVPPPATCTSSPSPATCPQPASSPQVRTVDVPYCPQLVVNSHQESRTVNWTWSDTTKQWVQDPTPWTTVPGSETQRAAGAADCVKIVDHVPAHAALPDLRIKDLTRCGAGDMLATGGTCFMIDPSAPYNASFPQLQGHKLLKFGVVTLNVGAGSGEVIADRSATNVNDWKAYQTFYDASGNVLGSMVDPNVQFYFAGDGHNHWHVRDFDEYDLLDASGTTIAHAEKHGYCMQDNTTWDPMQGQPGVSTQPVYAESTSCGKGLPNALTIVHGLSRGWGDTYPTSLPDQAIDITGLPDGRYTVRVHADAVGAVVESNDGNNTAQVQVDISGDTVTVVPGSSQGGL